MHRFLPKFLKKWFVSTSIRKDAAEKSKNTFINSKGELTYYCPSLCGQVVGLDLNESKTDVTYLIQPDTTYCNES